MSDDQSQLQVLTPGAYLRARRWVAGLSIDEVAARLSTDPRLGEVDRIDLLKSIEADVAPASFSTIVALRIVFSFDLDALALLDAIARGQMPISVAPVLCALCGSQPGDIIPSHLKWLRTDHCPVCTTFAAPAEPIEAAA